VTSQKSESLSDVAGKKPGKFSLGMSQRLGIAAAILGEPKYLLLDEPANGLDPEGIAWLRSFIKDYADKGNAVFVSSHLLSEMAQMADNIVVIGKGKLIADTSMEKLVSESAASGAYVRSPKMEELKAALLAEELEVKAYKDGVKVAGTTTDTVGEIAHRTNLPIYELTAHTASLEEAFLELTAGSEEYISKTEVTK
jgi:ABC-2 type transport system ATP-binding protein